jgi:hypothetical protein
MTNMLNIASLSHITRSEGDPKVIHAGPSSRGVPDSLAKALGWFSLGLGLTELLAPRRITSALGMEGKEALVRAYGVREIGSGILSLSVDKKLGLWSRVAGDGVDLATVLSALRSDNPKRDNVVVGLALLLPSPSNRSPIAATSSKTASTTQTPAMGGIPVQQDISRPITEMHSVQQSRPAPAPLAQSVIPAKPTQSAEVTRSAAHPVTSHNPMPAPLVRETSVPVSTSRAPTPSSAASMSERTVGIRNQPSLDLRLAAAARMDRAPPPGFEPHPIPQPGNNPKKKEDPLF